MIEDNPQHRRAKLVQLTEAGQRLYAQISQIQVQWVNSVSAGFDANELNLAVKLLRDINMQ